MVLDMVGYGGRGDSSLAPAHSADRFLEQLMLGDLAPALELIPVTPAARLRPWFTLWTAGHPGNQSMACGAVLLDPLPIAEQRPAEPRRARTGQYPYAITTLQHPLGEFDGAVVLTAANFLNDGIRHLCRLQAVHPPTE